MKFVLYIYKTDISLLYGTTKLVQKSQIYLHYTDSPASKQKRARSLQQ